MECLHGARISLSKRGIPPNSSRPQRGVGSRLVKAHAASSRHFSRHRGGRPRPLALSEFVTPSADFRAAVRHPRAVAPALRPNRNDRASVCREPSTRTRVGWRAVGAAHVAGGAPPSHRASHQPPAGQSAAMGDVFRSQSSAMRRLRPRCDPANLVAAARASIVARVVPPVDFPDTCRIAALLG